MSELMYIVNQLDGILPQIGDFISQFNNIILENKINIITDTASNMFMDIPTNVPEPKAEHLKKKLEVLDRLINTRTDEADKLLKKGSELESTLKINNPEFKSIILDKLNEYKKLKYSYKH